MFSVKRSRSVRCAVTQSECGQGGNLPVPPWAASSCSFLIWHLHVVHSEHLTCSWFLVPPISCWDGSPARKPQRGEVSAPWQLCIPERRASFFFGLGCRWHYKSLVLAKCGCRRPGVWLLSFPSATAWKAPLSLPSKLWVIKSFEGIERERTGFIRNCWHQQKCLGAAELKRVLDLESEHLGLSHGSASTNYKNLSKPFNFSKGISYH